MSIAPAKPLPEHAPVVVVGGGIIGASILYHLARIGIPAVLLERRKLGSGTTWHAAGIVGQLRESKAQTDLARYTARLFHDLEEETGQATGYRRTGSISVALNPVRFDLLKRTVVHAERVGVEARLLTPDELAGLWPMLDLDGVLGASFVPSNGQVNPLDVTQALVKGARARGAAVHEDTPVIDVIVRDGRVVAVETGRGAIATGTVVLAGGMWTHRLAKRLGVAVPLAAAEHFYIVTEPVPGLPRSLPVLSVADERIYAKEDTGKLLLGGFEARGKAWPPAGAIPDDFEFDGLPFDMEHVEPLLETAFRRIPVLAEVGVQLFFCGPESFTPDGRPILGPAPGVAGLFVAAGMNSNGILNSGGVGKVMAGWIRDGRPEASMLSLRVDRFMPFQANDAYVRARAEESIGLHMSLPWPGLQPSTARGVRRGPLHDRHVAAGAVFGERAGWEVPMWYGAPGGGWPAEPAVGRQAWFPAVEAECLAVRDAAGIADLSIYAKIGVHGPGATALLDRVASAAMDVPVGTSVYTPLLDERGGVQADVVALRLAPDRWLVISGHPAQLRDAELLRSAIRPGEPVAVVDETSAFAILAVTGPASRAILEALSPDDLSAAAFPFGAVRTIDLAFARPVAIRRSFFGELGFELLIPTEFAAHVHEAIVAAGGPHGLRPVGFLAMNHCRMEKGFRHHGHDVADDDTPLEAGLGFAVAWDKPGGFAGREALLPVRGAVPVRRLAQVAIAGATADRGPFLLHNEPVRRDGRIVGHITSGAWGFRTGLSLGIASLARDEGVTAGWLAEGGFAVDVGGVRYPAEVRLGAFYDPEGVRMRG